MLCSKEIEVGRKVKSTDRPRGDDADSRTQNGREDFGCNAQTRTEELKATDRESRGEKVAEAIADRQTRGGGNSCTDRQRNGGCKSQTGGVGGDAAS